MCVKGPHLGRIPQIGAVPLGGIAANSSPRTEEHSGQSRQLVQKDSRHKSPVVKENGRELSRDLEVLLRPSYRVGPFR